MHKLVHNLTMFVVLYHLLVGCCCHHAHGVDTGHWHDAGGSRCVSVADEERDSHRDCDHHSGEPDSGGQRRGCHEEHCVFVVLVTDGATRLVGQSYFPTSPGATFTSVVFSSPVQQACRSLPHPCITPLRLHLMNQILLI